MSRRVLLVVNMLNDYIKKDGALYCGEAVINMVPLVQKKVSEFVSLGMPVILIMDAHDPEDLEFQRFPRHCVYGTEGAELVDDLKSILEEYSFAIKVPKNRHSAFYRTNLHGILRDLNPETVEVVGVCTNLCVLYTVEELCNRDYKVVVCKDGVVSFDADAHLWAIKQMAEVLGAEVR